MAPTKMQNSKGVLVNAEQLDFKPISEPTAEYELEDGTKITIRMVLAEVFRLDEKDPVTGRSEYFIKSAPIVSIKDKKKQ